MRYFYHEVEQAASYTGRVPAPEFSWSPSRQGLFERCQRAYFFYYYLAQGGWDTQAAPESRNAFRDKYALYFNQWLSETLQEAIRDALRKTVQSAPNHREKDFFMHLLQTISRQASDLLISLRNKEYLLDPKKPVIVEYLRRCENAFPPEKLSGRAVEILSSAYAALTKLDLIKSMLRLNFTDLRLDDRFLSLDVDGFNVYFSPGIIFFDGDQVHSLKCRAVSDQDSTGEIQQTFAWETALFELYAAERFPGRIPSCTCLSFNRTGCSIVMTDPEKDILSKIRSNAARMLAKIAPDGTVDPAEFPLPDDRTQCSLCRFRKTCIQIASRIKGCSSN